MSFIYFRRITKRACVLTLTGVFITAAGGVSAQRLMSGSGPTERSDVGLLPIPASQMHGDDLLDWIGPLGSLSDITRTADVVAVGRFVGLKGTNEIFPTSGAQTANGHSTGVMFTLLVFEVDEVIKGAVPKQIIVRQTGDLARGLTPATFPAPAQGEQLLVFLTREPFGDGTWASVNGPWGRMKVEGGVLKYQGGADRNIVEYMQAGSLAQAVNSVKAEVARQEARR